MDTNNKQLISILKLLTSNTKKLSDQETVVQNICWALSWHTESIIAMLCKCESGSCSTPATMKNTVTNQKLCDRCCAEVLICTSKHGNNVDDQWIDVQGAESIRNILVHYNEIKKNVTIVH